MYLCSNSVFVGYVLFSAVMWFYSVNTMDNKRKQTDSDLNYYANMSDSEQEDLVDLESNNYESLDDASEDSNEDSLSL